MKKILLSDISVGQNAIVSTINDCSGMRQRFMDLGLIRGSSVCCVLSCAGSMRAYNVRGSVIAIRQRDAISVTVEVEEDENSSPCG